MITAAVFSYGFGNVRLMVRALANLGVDTTLTSDYRQSLEADGLVVPGVSVFAAYMGGLKKVDGGHVVYGRIRANHPVFGMRVGEQIMFEHGLRHGAHVAGIGPIDSSVNLLDADVVPHMGWDTIEATPDSALLNGVENEWFYFAHSCAAVRVKPADISHFDIDLSDSPKRVGWCSYSRSRFAAAYGHGSLFVTQLHPEKSGDVGFQLLKNWIVTL